MEVVKFSEVFVQLFLKKVAEGTNKIEMLIMFVGKMTYLPIVYDENLYFLFGFYIAMLSSVGITMARKS